MTLTPAKLRRLAGEYDTSAAQLRSAAELLDRDPENPDVGRVVGEIVQRVPALSSDRKD
jgi:hypothetical protein